MNDLSNKTTYGEVVDLFCGVGSLSHGLKRAGFNIMAGYDIDARCKHAYQKNNHAKFILHDVANLTAREVSAHFTGEGYSVLAGCAPCQPFSTYRYRYKEEDPKWSLVGEFGRLAAEIQSDFLTMENVPSLVNYKKGEIFNELCETLEKAGYLIEWSIVKCEQFGIPQKRRRLVLIASKHTRPESLKPQGKEATTVRQAIGHLKPIQAGMSDPDDPLHMSASLMDVNLARIRESKQGGTWWDWPVEMRAKCHRRKSGMTYVGVYGRMSWDEPSPTMTTQCFSFGSGRFGHPDQDRAISLREAALLQSFPKSYEFLPSGETYSFVEIGRWIGNAVPVRLAEEIGRLIASMQTVKDPLEKINAGL
ncbi:MAG: DNA cytosine methyltransferase [Gammaproteobacteria bacterium]|nr:DNA cytosine methyltransferase [Gammaproteobacteria bacterium]MCY4312406.1 DNA cytosine methyltransferase [Gammaproteobacteria bacterium]